MTDLPIVAPVAPTFIYESMFEHGALIIFATDCSLHADKMYGYINGQPAFTEDFSVLEHGATSDAFFVGVMIEENDMKRFRQWLEQLNAVGYPARGDQPRWNLGVKS